MARAEGPGRLGRRVGELRYDFARDTKRPPFGPSPARLGGDTSIIGSSEFGSVRILNSPPAPWMFPSKGSGGRCFLQASARPAEPLPLPGKAGVSLSEWEGEFLDSVSDRVKTHGRAFADPEKGAPGQALSAMQGRKIKEIIAKSKGEQPKRRWGRRKTSSSNRAQDEGDATAED